MGLLGRLPPWPLQEILAAPLRQPAPFPLLPLQRQCGPTRPAVGEGEEGEDVPRPRFPFLLFLPRLPVRLPGQCSKEAAPEAAAVAVEVLVAVVAVVAVEAVHRGAEGSSILPHRQPSACSTASDTGRPAGSDDMVAPVRQGARDGPKIPFAKRECMHMGGSG